jgi:hypothetical protein
MKFFIPYASTPEMAEQVYESIKKFAVSTAHGSPSQRRIFRIKYHHEGKNYQAEVGKEHRRIGEEVIAILESFVYLICSPNRGVVRGGPCMVGYDEVDEIEDFEEE